MKLIICPKCEDWVKLTYEMRTCGCGHTKGRYVNSVEAEVSKDAISVGVGNGSFVQALGRLIASVHQGKKYSRGEYIDVCGMIAWLRPNSGEGNPHTRVIED